MKKYDDTDPIKEVSGNDIFNTLHSFEENDEYEFEKEMNEYEEKYQKLYSNNTTENISKDYKVKNLNRDANMIGGILIFFIINAMFISIQTEINNIKNEGQAISEDFYSNIVEEENYYSNEVEEHLDYTKEYYTKAYYIKFGDYEAIPTVYKHGNYDEYYYFKESLYDSRFKTNTSLLEIKYDNLPLGNIIQYKKELHRRKYQQVGIYDGGDIFIKQVDEDYFLFVIISEEFAIYGCGSGDYNETFDLK